MTQALKITVLTVGIGVAVWALSSSSMACTLMMNPPRPGETIEQAALREERAAQVASWNEADSIFLARVVETAQVENDGVRYTFETIAPVRGAAPPKRLSNIWYSDGCHGRAWSRGEVAVVYADRIGFLEDWSRWGQWVEVDAVLPSVALDPRVAPALRASAHRLRTSRR